MESTNNLVTRSVNDVSAKKTFKSMTVREKCAYAKTVITVEPLLVLYFLPTMICSTGLYTLEIEKACRVNSAIDDIICDDILRGNLTPYKNETDEISRVIANMHSWQSPMQSVVPVILILFLASYSDRHKIRKPFMLIPILGEFLAIAGCIICVVFMRELPIEVQGFSQTVLPSILGGPTTLIMAVFAYISDVSTIEMRTLRIGIIQIVLTIFTVLSALGGYLFTLLGYYGVLGLGGVMYLAAFCYGLFYIKESSKRPVYKNCNSFFRDVFDPMHAINTLKLLITRNDAIKSGQLYIVLVTFFVSALVANGEFSVFGLFALKTYGYTPIEYSYFDSIKNVLTVIGTIIFLPLFTKVFKLHDAVIVVVTFLDKVASNLLLIIFANKYGLYIGTIVANCHTLGNTALRSLMTKTVPLKDLAKALSLLSLTETIASMVTSPLYNLIFTETLEVYPQSFLFVGVILFSQCCILITVVYVFFRRIFSTNEPDKKEPSQPMQDRQTALSQTTKL